MAENYINLSNDESLFEYKLWGDHNTQRMIPHSLNKNKPCNAPRNVNANHNVSVEHATKHFNFSNINPT